MSHYPPRWLMRSSEPEVEPVSVSEAKTFLRIDGSAEDGLIGDLIKTARILAEEITGKALVTQDWVLQYGTHVPQQVPLPYLPVQEVLNVTRYDEDENSLGAVSATGYHLSARRDTLMFESMPDAPLVRISYRAGYGDAASDVPQPIRQAMLIHVASLYEQRDSLNPPAASMSLYHGYREVRL